MKPFDCILNSDNICIFIENLFENRMQQIYAEKWLESKYASADRTHGNRHQTDRCYACR